MSKRIKNFLAAMAIVALGTGPALAGPAEIELLSSYIGNWRGQGVVSGSDTPESFTCRLTIAKGNSGKVNYTGRCTLVDANLSISGTIAYNDDGSRYEAVMSSNAGYTGTAVGRIQGGRIDFDLREQQKDRSGSDVRIGSRIVLVNDQITVDFEIEFNDSGEVLTASVPFNR